MEKFFFFRSVSEMAQLQPMRSPQAAPLKKKKKNLMPHLLFQEFLMRNREFFYLALSFKAGNTLSKSEAVDLMQKCIRDIQDWMAKNRLKMNDGKTKFVISGTRQQLGKHSVTRLSVGNTPYRDYNICQESWSMNGPQVVF